MKLYDGAPDNKNVNSSGEEFYSGDEPGFKPAKLHEMATYSVNFLYLDCLHVMHYDCFHVK